MARPDKAAAVAELTEKFQSSSAAVLTEYRGLTVAQLTRLRQTISEHATYAVVKNTLTDIAAREAGVTAFEGQLSGPSAIAFVTGDPVETARSMRDFARENPALVIRGGLLEGRPLTADEVRQLADLEPREVLLAKLAGAMKASLAGAAATFNALPVQMAQIAEALRAKRAEAEGGAPEASAAEASTPEASTPEASTPEASTPEASTPEASAPEASAPDAQAAPGDGDEG